MTEKLYYKNQYLKENKSKILEIIDDGNYSLIILDKTIFSPGGGGEDCDLGFIDRHKIIDVFEENSKIYHKIKNPISKELKEGNIVNTRLDWERRFKNIQRHCAEHILAGVFYNTWRGENVGFHMGDEYMTIDIRFPDDIDIEEISKIAEFRANEVIWQNIDISTHHYDTIEEVNKLNLRKKSIVSEDIRVVKIGSHDQVSCCGSHPKKTGEVGFIKIYKAEKRKNSYRFYFDSGENAVNRIHSDFKILNDVNIKLSSKTEDILDRIKLKEEETESYKSELINLKKTILTEKLKNEIDSKRIILEEDILTPKDIMRLSSTIEEYKNEIIISFKKMNSIIIYSKDNEAYLEKLKDIDFKGGGKKILSLRFKDSTDFNKAISKITI